MRHWLPWSTKEFSQQKKLKFQLSSRDSMAAKYTVRQAVELLFDDEFGLSDGDILAKKKARKCIAIEGENL